MVAALKNQDISLFLFSSLHSEPEQWDMTVLENVTAIKYSARDNAAASNHEEMTDKPVI